jgi:hypothetical protein
MCHPHVSAAQDEILAHFEIVRRCIYILSPKRYWGIYNFDEEKVDDNVFNLYIVS